MERIDKMIRTKEGILLTPQHIDESNVLLRDGSKEENVTWSSAKINRAFGGNVIDDNESSTKTTYSSEYLNKSLGKQVLSIHYPRGSRNITVSGANVLHLIFDDGYDTSSEFYINNKPVRNMFNQRLPRHMSIRISFDVVDTGSYWNIVGDPVIREWGYARWTSTGRVWPFGRTVPAGTYYIRDIRAWWPEIRCSCWRLESNGSGNNSGRFGILQYTASSGSTDYSVLDNEYFYMPYSTSIYDASILFRNETKVTPHIYVGATY